MNETIALIALGCLNGANNTEATYLEIIKEFAEGHAEKATDLLANFVAHSIMSRYYEDECYRVGGIPYYIMGTIISARLEVYETRTVIDFEAEVYSSDEYNFNVIGTIDLGTGEVKIREPEQPQNHTFSENLTYHRKKH